VLAEKFFELIGIKIGQDFVARDKCGHIRLRGKFFHVLVRVAIFTNVDLPEAIPFLAEIILCINTPGAPFATIEL
jgi:hypothetical protein